jgi:hypothetical protein
MLLFAPAVSAAPITFELLPAAIEGEAGSTIGWGYTVTNQSDFWLELTNIDADAFQFATADATPFDYAILAPGETHTVVYNPTTLEGLYQLTGRLAPIGFTNSGLFVRRPRIGTPTPSMAGTSSPMRCPSRQRIPRLYRPSPSPGRSC